MSTNERLMATTWRFEINKGKSITGEATQLARIQQQEDEKQELLAKKKFIIYLNNKKLMKFLKHKKY